MGRQDTSIGGGDRFFRTTDWSSIVAAGDPASPQYAEHWARLVRTYWKPAYCYIRAAWRRSNEDAKDLTQTFFTHLFQKGVLSKFRPEIGSFRRFLKCALSNFLIDQHRSERAQGPATPAFSIDANREVFEQLGPASPQEPPEQAFDRQWFQCVFEEAVGQLETVLAGQGKSLYFHVFRLYCLDASKPEDPGRTTAFLRDKPGAGRTYREVAAKLGVRESDVRNYLTHCRAELRKLVRQSVRQYVASEEDVEAELREVLKG